MRYRLVVDGELSAKYSTAFEGMSLECVEGTTVISGPVQDQAQLQGLLQRVASLGLTLVSVGPDGGT